MRRLLKTFILVVLISTVASSVAPSQAFAEFASDYPGVSPAIGPAANPGLTHGEQALNFGALYVAQWAFYLVQQNKTIIEQGSFQHMRDNWYRPHFDNDSFEYNIFKHSLTGMSYYQFYRSRGYGVERAFLWTFASSLVFEFTIETLTERPSFQDIYQTPVYGVILGFGFEKISQACHSTDTFLGHACGYLFDPFTLIPATPKFAILPDFKNHSYVASATWEF